MFSALLDRCVLVPSVTRDVLLEIAERDVYRPLWSSEILNELTRTTRKLRGGRGFDLDVIDVYVSRLTTQMKTAFPDAIVADWSAHVASIQLPDADDRHVVAVAVAGRADVIVTDNIKDSPAAALPKPLFTLTADMFLLDSFDLQPEAVCAALHNVAARSGRLADPRTPHDATRPPPWLAILARCYVMSSTLFLPNSATMRRFPPSAAT